MVAAIRRRIDNQIKDLVVCKGHSAKSVRRWWRLPQKLSSTAVPPVLFATARVRIGADNRKGRDRSPILGRSTDGTVTSTPPSKVTGKFVTGMAVSLRSPVSIVSEIIVAIVSSVDLAKSVFKKTSRPILSTYASSIRAPWLFRSSRFGVSFAGIYAGPRSAFHPTVRILRFWSE